MILSVHQNQTVSEMTSHYQDMTFRQFKNPKNVPSYMLSLAWPAKFRETFREIFISHFAKFLNYFREISRYEIYENFAKFRESDFTKLYRN
jgi:hypothetical protein